MGKQPAENSAHGADIRRAIEAANAALPAGIAPEDPCAGNDVDHFPTVGVRDDGWRSYWNVPADTGSRERDWATGERLARETVARMQREPEKAWVLRRVLRELDYDSGVGQGFLSWIEDRLAWPEGASGNAGPAAVLPRAEG